jgi:hypothetical protein
MKQGALGMILAGTFVDGSMSYDGQLRAACA